MENGEKLWKLLENDENGGNLWKMVKIVGN